MYSPSSANLGTIWLGGKSTYLGLLAVSIIFASSSSVSLFLGEGRLVIGL